MNNTAKYTFFGVITEYVRAKGYGYITADDGRKYFFRDEDLLIGKKRDIRPGQMVLFDTVLTEYKGKLKRQAVALTI